MIKLFRYLKGYALAIILIVIFLFIQAYCDLALPSYTSDIVNVGIQQSGISESVPKAVGKEDMDSLNLFLEGKESDEFMGYYKIVSYDKSTKEERKKYPGLKQEDIYLLKSNEVNDEENTISIQKSLDKAIMMNYYMASDSSEMDQVKTQMGLEKDQNMLDVLKAMPVEQSSAIIEKMMEQFGKMPDSIISQAATAGIKMLYENAGEDVDQIQTNYLLVAGAKMIGLAFLGMIVAIIVMLLSSRVAAGFGMKLRNKIFHKVLAFTPKEFNDFSTASLITRSTNDVQQVQMLITMVFRIVLFAPILGIGGFIKVLQTDSNMEWIIGLAVLVIAIVVLSIFIIFMPFFKRLQKLIDRVNLVMREILSGLSVIRAFSKEKTEEQRFDDANKVLTKTNLITSRVMVIMMPIMMLIMNLTTVLVVYRGAYGINDGVLQVGDMMAFIQYAMQIMMSFLMISMISIMIPRASVSGVRISEILDTKISLKDKEETVVPGIEKKGYVEFKDVSFTYPDGEENVIEHVDFVAEPGKTTAIIGSTGCGKSTLINLIPRFFDVTEGAVLVDGIDVRDMKQETLREKIGYVPQKATLFSGTIASNMRFGKNDATKEEIEKAIEIAQATEFVEEKPEGVDTFIAQGGSNVSGGQKQRLSIARAIVKKPEILIFDDSFSALDFKTDASLRKALKEETAESTVFIVAQRISTILKAEQILVLDEGKLVGKGNHIELLRDCEEYRQIAMSQLSEDELKEDMKKAGLEGFYNE